MKTKTFLTLLLLVVGCSCSKTDKDNFKEVPFRTLFSGCNPPDLEYINKKEIISNEVELQKIGEVLRLTTETINSFKIDFSQKQVIIIWGKEERYTPSSINVTSVAEDNTSIVVHTVSEVKGLGAAFSCPFCMIEIPKTNKNITYKNKAL